MSDVFLVYDRDQNEIVDEFIGLEEAREGAAKAAKDHLPHVTTVEEVKSLQEIFIFKLYGSVFPIIDKEDPKASGVTVTDFSIFETLEKQRVEKIETQNLELKRILKDLMETEIDPRTWRDEMHATIDDVLNDETPADKTGEMRALLREICTYLNHGNKTAIYSSSLFHVKIRELLQKVDK